MSDRPHRILIIEDSPEDRAAYRRRIAQGREREFDFWETGSGVEGLKLCGDVQPDCILLDYQLPDLDGLEFLKQWQAQASAADIPVIMLTGHGNEAVAVQAMKTGAYDYLIKGLNSDHVRQAVTSALDRRALRAQVEEQRRELERMSAERLQLIAELKAQAEVMAEAGRRKDEFLAMLAHELRNPLAPIRNALHIMKLAKGEAALVEQSHALMERQVHHMVRLVDDLLDVTRITRGKVQLCKERVDFGALVNRAVGSCQALIDERKHELAVALPPAPLWLEADGVRLEQVIANLVNNAAKYTPAGGKLRVAVERDRDQVVVRVRDNGIGITPELLPRIFEMFIQGDHSLARTQGGLGIGLTLVQLLVQLHGGSVRAESDGPGRGTEFIVCLPLGDHAGDAAVLGGRPTSTRAAAAARVLVVDDNKDGADSLGQLLTLAGHEVRVAYDGPAALAVAETFRPQLVLLDIGMPTMDGYEVARRLRARRRADLVIVAVTGYGQEPDRCRSRQAGCDHHFVKPISLEKLEVIFESVSAPTP